MDAARRNGRVLPAEPACADGLEFDCARRLDDALDLELVRIVLARQLFRRAKEPGLEVMRLVPERLEVERAPGVDHRPPHVAKGGGRGVRVQGDGGEVDDGRGREREPQAVPALPRHAERGQPGGVPAGVRLCAKTDGIDALTLTR